MAGGGAPAEEAGPKQNVFGESPPAPVDLNLTALMDILSNLLFFLLASFGATIVMSINGTVPVQSADKSDVADNKLSVTVALKVTKDNIEVTASGTAQTEQELEVFHKIVPSAGGKPDFASLTAHLKHIKDTYPKSDTVLMTPEPGVPYSALIQTMDAAREVADPATKKQLPLFPTVVMSTVVK